MMTDDNTEGHYLLTLQGVVLVTMAMDGDVANQAKVEIAELVTAWWHGQRLLPAPRKPANAGRSISQTSVRVLH